MSLGFLPPVIKKAGYILLMVSAGLFFLNTSGLLMLGMQGNEYETLHEVFNAIGLFMAALAIVFIVFGKTKNDGGYISNRLLLPHYFKYVGYVYLFFTLLYAFTSYKYQYSKSVRWHTQVIIPSYQDGLTDEQKKVFDSMKDGGIVEHVSRISVTPLTMILPVGLLFLAFAREKDEDEMISIYRTQSLQLAILLLFFVVLYQKFYLPDVETLVITSKKGVGYFDIPAVGLRADILINVVLIFSILRMEYMLRLKPLFTKGDGA